MARLPFQPVSSSAGTPPVVDRESWQTVCDALLAREKAHTREGTPSQRRADDCR